MSLYSANTFLAKQCASCEEIMPRWEKVCYCGGPVTLTRLPLDKKKFSNCYFNRRFMFKLRQTKAPDVDE